eukprot:gnl/TRDRNA2_/TRDRNA2_128618_c3_seq1.p1 gnl/TRDRNA2_/TRDRNA2_128618_c3~~gnl/TRDRNA2_/TRDRNA2_128618_c3_seq1.p1  ORF type:complete len:526 (+),score=58.50 gnl/TRDRNA2_/TRDRNA2_128618_c3_seq1:1-1578(+)
MSNFDHLRTKLQCAPFSHYIARFPYVYIDTGLIPDEVFQLREETTGRCLERVPRANPPHGLVLAPCAGMGQAGGVPELQLWHTAIRKRWQPQRRRNGDGTCCGGLANWNFNQCISAMNFNNHLETSECEISGNSFDQYFAVASDGGNSALSWRFGEGCAAPTQPQSDDRAPTIADCGTVVVAEGTEMLTPVEGESVPATFQLRDTSDGRSSAVCLAYADATAEMESKTPFTDCKDGEVAQLFRASLTGNGFRVELVGIEGAEPLCLDVAGGASLLAYPCYPANIHNDNQVWRLERGRIVWAGDNSGKPRQTCVHLAHGSGQVNLKEISGGGTLTLASCSGKYGQNIKRESIHDSSDLFILRDADTGKCLGDGGAPPGGIEKPLRLGPCSDSQHWRELHGKDQIQHVGTKLCIDAGNEVNPILYACHKPKAQRKQRFYVAAADPHGSVRMYPGWEDNGRKRYFEKCLDHSPQPAMEVAVISCQDANAAGIHWTKLGAFVPPETKLWEKASKPAPGSPRLGGGVVER